LCFVNHRIEPRRELLVSKSTGDERNLSVAARIACGARTHPIDQQHVASPHGATQ
jgi:hypothetical protein